MRPLSPLPAIVSAYKPFDGMGKIFRPTVFVTVSEYSLSVASTMPSAHLNPTAIVIGRSLEFQGYTCRSGRAGERNEGGNGGRSKSGDKFMLSWSPTGR